MRQNAENACGLLTMSNNHLVTTLTFGSKYVNFYNLFNICKFYIKAPINIFWAFLDYRSVKIYVCDGQNWGWRRVQIHSRRSGCSVKRRKFATNYFVQLKMTFDNLRFLKFIFNA